MENPLHDVLQQAWLAINDRLDSLGKIQHVMFTFDGHGITVKGHLSGYDRLRH